MMRWMLFILVLLSAVLSGCKKDDAITSDAKPSITSMEPAQVTIGQQDVRGRIRGANFLGIVAIDLGPGIQILKTKIVTPTELSVKFSVSANAAPGPRTIKVTTAAGVAASSAVFSINSNSVPRASFTADPPRGTKGAVFTFDASDSSDADGTIESYDWNFGDGKKGSGKVVTHQYESARTFTVTLTVKDNHQSTAAANKNVLVENLIAPVPHFNFSPKEGNATTQFRFDGADSTDSDGRIVKHSWDFGDGTTAQGKVVQHKYSGKDLYWVTLTVTDNDGLESSVEKDLQVKGIPPVAGFTVTPEQGPPDTVFLFDPSASSDADGTIDRYEWVFGDGSSRQDKIVQHRFENAGTYSVKLTVTDNDGMSHSSTKNLNVVEDDGGGGEEGQCTTPSKKRETFFFQVLSEDRTSKVITGKFLENVTCSDVFYLCGDVRKGGIKPGEKEYWMGTICEMYSLGNNVFRIHLVDGKDWIEVGERGTYVWPQLDCNPSVVCR